MLSIISFIGAIGLFLYGMKLLSEGLQKIAGDSMRQMLVPVTRNRFAGMITGTLVTALIQSSAATTVMIVSFVNAGLITLSQSMPVIMGANVGTTAIVWVIALLGFKYSILQWVFPLIALALPLLQSRHAQRNSWGSTLLGFALLFLSLSAMQYVLPAESCHPGALGPVLSLLSGSGTTAILLALTLGLLFTIVIQASSASVVIGILLCSSGWLSVEAACALVLGANIGTCVTPLLATRSANTMAKRAALGHMLFNLTMAIWALALTGFAFHDSICWLSDTLGWGFPTTPAQSGYATQVAFTLALFHTLINVVNLCLLLPLNRWFVQLITRLTPENDKQEEPFKLQFISSGLISSGELALIQVQKETSRYAQETFRMFRMVQSMLSEPVGSDKLVAQNEQIRLMEEKSDQAEVEIADYLNHISPKTLSWQGEQMSRSLYKIVDELESVADSFYHISATLLTRSELRVRFSKELNAHTQQMFQLTEAALTHMLKVLEAEHITSSSLSKAYNIEDEINNFRNEFRNLVLDRFDRQEVEYQQSTLFMMLVNECEKIGDYVINIVTAAYERNMK